MKTRYIYSGRIYFRYKKYLVRIKGLVIMKPVVIAGNGPSLAHIDYTMLPTDYDVYRCNQFYFEEQYFLGKDITAVFFNPDVFFEQYYTLKQLLIRKEYTYKTIYCSKMFWRFEDVDPTTPFQFLYPDVVEVYKLLQKYPSILSFLKYNDVYLGQRITSGVLMALVAAINGYKELYLTGIDFYETKEYVFNHHKPNLQKLIPVYTTRIKADFHTKNIDVETLKFIEQEFDVQIYSLSPTSPISTLYPPPSMLHAML